MKSLPPGQVRIYEAAMRIFAQEGATHTSVSELALAAGVARGTIYNNVADLDSLFEDVATALANEMHERVSDSFQSIDDPAHRLARGILLFVRRAHEEPHWGRFVARFGLTTATLRGMLRGQPAVDLKDGLASGRYVFRAEQLEFVIAFIGSSTLGAMWLVINGEKAWRDAGPDTAELILRSIGVPVEEARALAVAELPPLPG